MHLQAVKIETVLGVLSPVLLKGGVFNHEVPVHQGLVVPQNLQIFIGTALHQNYLRQFLK
jgi:hypothetical protein